MDPHTAAIRTDASNAAWIGAAELASSDVSDTIRGWLTYAGLLSTRMRELFGRQYALKLVRETPVPSAPLISTRIGCADGSYVKREIEILNGKQRAMFAQSFFPSFTLDQQPWLLELGTASLGEKLAAVSGVSRGPLEFRQLTPEHPLARAASKEAQPLWARRSVFAIDGAPLLVTEVFLPELEQWNPL